MKLKPWRAIVSPVGVSAETIALSAAIALLLGVFPVYGFPTLFCAVAAVLFRLNLPAMQAVNLLSSPLQLALLAPFARLGGRMLPLPDPMLHGGAQLAARAGAALLHAVTGWCCVAIPLGILLYVTLKPAVRSMERIRLKTA